MTVIGEQSTSAKSEIRTKCDLWVFSRTSLLSSGLFIRVGHNSNQRFVETLRYSSRENVHVSQDTSR